MPTTHRDRHYCKQKMKNSHSPITFVSHRNVKYPQDMAGLLATASPSMVPSQSPSDIVHLVHSYSYGGSANDFPINAN